MSAGKGDKYRNVDLKTYESNYDKIFRKKPMTHNFTSRRRAPRFFEQTENPDVWIFGGEAFDFEYCRYGGENGEISFVDPADGPFVSVNSKFSDYCCPEEDRVIKRIVPTDRGIELHTEVLA